MGSAGWLLEGTASLTTEINTISNFILFRCLLGINNSGMANTEML